jgi:hypothetical protein
LWRIVYALVGGAILVAVVIAGLLYYELSGDDPETFFDNPVKQFKYGSTGGDLLAGLPVGIFKAMPTLCRDYLPGKGWESLGFTYEEGMDRPVGTSRRHSLGFDRIALNCAACHVGTYRDVPQSPREVVTGMPSHRVDLARFTKFVTQCVLDERFNPWQVIEAAEQTGEHYSAFQRLLIKYAVVPAMREAVLLVRDRFRFLDREVEPGPGRFDTFNPAKALLNWPFELLPLREAVGIVDFPSLWLQGPREELHMHLHWDGNNDSVEERNRSAAFGSGAVPTTLDRRSLKFIADWLISTANRPPKYPFPIDAARPRRASRFTPNIAPRVTAPAAATSAVDRAATSARSTRSTGSAPIPVGSTTTPIRSPPSRATFYAAYPSERFSHFRKTNGYANLPLDGIWLRGPYCTTVRSRPFATCWRAPTSGPNRSTAATT